MNMPLILIIIYGYALLVLDRALYIDYIALVIVPWGEYAALAIAVASVVKPIPPAGKGVSVGVALVMLCRGRHCQGPGGNTQG